MPDQKSIPQINPQNQPDPSFKTSNNQEKGNLEIIHTFPKEKKEEEILKPQKPGVSQNQQEEEVKDIFEEGLKFEPPQTSESQAPESSESKIPSPPSPKPKTEIPPVAPETLPPQSPAQSPKFDKTPDSKEQLVGMDTLRSGKLPKSSQVQAPAPKKKSLLGLIIGIIVVLIILGGGGYIYFAYFAQKTITLALNVEKASIKIDNQDYSSKLNNQILEVKLTGDIHNFEISKDDYFTYKKRIDISKLSGNRLEIDLRPYPSPEQLMKYPVDYLKSDFENQKLYYRSNQGKTLYSIILNSQGKVQKYQTLTSEIMANITNLIWHPKFNSVIIQIPANKTANTIFSEGGNSGTKTFLYNFETKTAQYLGNNIQEINFSQDSELIYYNQNNLLMKTETANPTKDPEQILDIGKAELLNPKIIPSSSDEYLALIPQFNQTSKNHIYLFDLSQKELTELVSDGNQINAVFSPDNSKLIYSTSIQDSENGRQLSWIDLETKAIQDLKINTQINNVLWIDSEIILYSYYNESSQTYNVAEKNLEEDSSQEYKYKSSITLEIKNIQYDFNNEQIYFINNHLIYYFKLDDGKY